MGVIQVLDQLEKADLRARKRNVIFIVPSVTYSFVQARVETELSDPDYPSQVLSRSSGFHLLYKLSRSDPDSALDYMCGYRHLFLIKVVNQECLIVTVEAYLLKVFCNRSSVIAVLKRLTVQLEYFEYSVHSCTP